MKKVKYYQTKPLGNVFENELRVFDVVCDFLLDPMIVRTHELKSFYNTLKNNSNPKSYLKHNNFEALFLIKKHLKKIQITKKYDFVMFVVSLNCFSHCCGYIKQQHGLTLANGYDLPPFAGWSNVHSQ